MKKLLCALLLMVPLWAEPPEGSADYQKAESAFQSQKYAQARQLTEALLKQEPDNYAALYLLGAIYHYGEGSIPRAYYCYKRARRGIEKAYPDHPESSASSTLYGVVLQELSETAQQLEHYQEALDLIDERDRLYPSQKQAARKGWPLLKLGRFEESRQLMLKLLDDPEHWAYRDHALNTLGNIEFETDNLEKSYEYFQKIAAEAGPGSDPVFYCNAGEAARDLLRYDESEKLMLKSTENFNPYTYSNPWGFLAELYAAESRMPEALEALKRMQAWRISASAQVSQNKWAECYGHAGSVLLQMGYDEKALEILERLIRRQDRNSSISTAPSLVEGRLVYLYSLALQRNIQRAREKLSYASWKEVPALLARLFSMERQVARERERAANLIASRTGIDGFIQPYGARALDSPSVSSACWTCFGPGAVIAAVERSLKLDKPEMAARKPYLTAILGEAYLYDWRVADCVAQLEEALKTLPAAEVKLRHRCEAVLVRALMQQGKRAEAMSHLQSLMDTDPSQLRACQVALPMTIESDGSQAANSARNWLYASPRCQRGSGGFTLKLQSDQEKVTGQLVGPDGTSAGRFEGQPRGNASDSARSFCEVFHAQAFAPIIDLSQGDIRSIDGSTGAVRADALKNLAE
ncbi:MAG: tetratricopeptide repeat protein [Candidatus Eremiobacteraeota bacterium]|nr:tetratricopeptide repeat protein [Candidatus Eremiobacteraeota bacterium]MCW5866773.1 tetratricopeptide repeat protein [Candidatus Eremiobacteraeota bacterium]